MPAINWLPEDYIFSGDEFPETVHPAQVTAIEFLFLQRRNEVILKALDSKSEAEHREVVPAIV